MQSGTWHLLSRGAIWRLLCLPRSSDIEDHSAAATASTDLGVSTLSVTFSGLRKSQRSPLYCKDAYIWKGTILSIFASDTLPPASQKLRHYLVITAESLPLHIVSSQSQNPEPLVSKRKSLTPKLRTLKVRTPWGVVSRRNQRIEFLCMLIDRFLYDANI